MPTVLGVISPWVSAAPKRRLSCLISFVTVVAFAPPCTFRLWVWANFRMPSATTQRSDFCRVFIFRSLVLRITACAEPDRSPWVRRIDSQIFITSPLRMQLPTNFGLQRYPPSYPLHTPYGASLSFVTLIAPMTSIGHALTEHDSHELMDLVFQVRALVSSVSGSLR